MSNILPFPERRSAIDYVKRDPNLHKLTNPAIDAIELMLADANHHACFVQASIENGETSFGKEDQLINCAYLAGIKECLEIIKDLSKFYKC